MMKSIVFFLLGTFCLMPELSVGQTNRTQDPDITDHLVSIAQNILSGRTNQESANSIAPGARLVSGSSNVDLRNVVVGTDTSFTLADRPPRQPNALQLKTNQNEDSAYLLLTTSNQGKDVRHHTIVFMRDKHGEWKIEIWHVSGP